MKLVYMSMTGHTRELANKLDMDSLELTPMNPFISISEPFIFIMPSYDEEMFNETAEDFLVENTPLCKGLIGTGNLNFGQLYCFAVDELSEQFDIPVVHKVEYSGTDEDIKQIRKLAERLEQ